VHPFDVFLIIAYMAMLTGVGLRLSRRQKTTERYFMADRTIPGWAAGLSLLATIITSVTFIAYPGSAYAGNWSMLVPGIMIVAVLALIGVVIVPFFRKVIAMSAYEFFGKRFGRAVRYYASLAFSIGQFAKMGFVLYLLSLTVSSMTGWPIELIIAVVGATTIFYTLIGGIEAVIWTDVLQSFVLWIGVAVSIACLLWLPPGGPRAALATAWQHHKFGLGSTQLRFDSPTIVVLAIYGFFYYLQKYTADQTVVQRYLVAKSDKAALRGLLMGAALCIPVWASFMFIGSLLWSFYHLSGEALPGSITKADQVFPYFLVTRMPVGLGGFFIASLFGAAMAMLASDMNCLALIGVEDFYLSWNKAATDKQRLRAGRWIVSATGIAGSVTAGLLARTHGAALPLYYTVTAIVAGGLAGLFLLAFFCGRAGKMAAHCGIIVCLLFTVWATLTAGNTPKLNLGKWSFPWDDYMIGAVGNVLLLATGLLVSWAFPVRQKIEHELTVWSWLRSGRSPVAVEPAARDTGT
jgi:SSS family solute:Na+ symporter